MPREELNLDGGLRHEDMFSLGDDDEDDDGADHDGSLGEPNVSINSPGTELNTPMADLTQPRERSDPWHDPTEADEPSSHSTLPTQYRIQPCDTLLGIALKCKVDVSQI